MPSESPFTVGAVLFPGFELLDIYGPLEMLSLLGNRVKITVLAQTPGEVPSSAGVKGWADASLAEPGELGLLIVPGGIGTRKEVFNETFLEMLRAKAEMSHYIASVCTGSALLAKAGLLDGREATSNKIAFDWVVQQGPLVKWIRKARWVEDEKFFTSSGITAGIDMTLAFISKVFGRDAAIKVARRAEYSPNEDKHDDPFA